mgnify:CR=1 FL=1|jgi:tetratricopeptide (TPR) repeat protein
MRFFLSISLILLLAQTSIGQSASEHFKSAQALYATGNFEQAIEELDRAIELNKSGDSYKLRADCFQKLGQLTSAMADYEFAEKRGCTALDLYLNRGICRTSLGMYDAAEKDLTSHIKAFPRSAVACYYLAVVAYLQMDNNLSLEWLNDALDYDPDYMAAYYLRGANYFEKGKLSKAEDDFRTAFSLDPTESRGALNLARILLEQLKVEEAMEQLLSISTEDKALITEINYYLAEAYFSLHNEDKACEYWLLAADQGDADAKRNHENICQKQNGRHKVKRTSFGEF